MLSASALLAGVDEREAARVCFMFAGEDGSARSRVARVRCSRVSEFRHMLDWTRRPTRRWLTKVRGSPNLFVLANKKETHDASKWAWPPFCKRGYDGGQGGG